MKVINPRVDGQVPSDPARNETRGLLPCEHELRIFRGKSMLAITEYLDAPAAERNSDEPHVSSFHHGFRITANLKIGISE